MEVIDELRADLRVLEENLSLHSERMGAVLRGMLQRERRRLEEDGP